MKKSGKFSSAMELFKQHHGILRMSEAIREGVNRWTLYSMLEEGIIERISRGLYRISGLPESKNPDFVSIAKMVPSGIICLISALDYHDMTTQIPKKIYIALKRGAERPRFKYPPVQVFWFKGKAFTEGVEIHKIDNVPVRIYSPEKTLADCFKYRNKLGLDTAIEALKLYRERMRLRPEEILKFAKICRVENVMRPYLESVL